MRHTVYKLFWAWEYEKEEKWINEMSRKGMALVSVGLCKYIFKDAVPGDYIYKIELLDKSPRNAESEAYIKFLEETGIEHISSLLRWIYLRKKAADGQFDLYSDMDSKISYLKRLRLFFYSTTLLELSLGIMNINLGINLKTGYTNINTVLGILLLLLAFILVKTGMAHTKKIKELQKEMLIRE